MKNSIALFLIMLCIAGCDSVATKPTNDSSTLYPNDTPTEKAEWESLPGFAKPYVSGDFWIMEFSPDETRKINLNIGDEWIGMIQQYKINNKYVTGAYSARVSNYIDFGYYDGDDDGHFELLIVNASETSPTTKVYLIDKEGNITPASQEKVDEINAISETFTELFQEKAPKAKNYDEFEQAMEETKKKLKTIQEK